MGLENKAPPLLLWFLLLPLLSMPTQNVYADYPSEALLNELKTRLEEVRYPIVYPVALKFANEYGDYR